MAANKRSKLERERDLQRISHEYLHGKTQQEMAQQFGVSQAQISYDLKILQKRWFKSSLENIAAVKARELAKIDALERAAWDAWEVSRKGQPEGNPTFLARVQWCIAQRCKILGIGQECLAPAAPPQINVAFQRITAHLTDKQKRQVIELTGEQQSAEQPTEALSSDCGVPKTSEETDQ
jgi:hypothetical protein